MSRPRPRTRVRPRSRPMPRSSARSWTGSLEADGPGSMRRIAVTGTSGSGKTTFARRLGERLGLPHIELDALFWRPGWVESDTESFRTRVAEAIAGEGWVVDGNYSPVRDLYLARVDTVVWLDLPLRVCFA